MARAHRFLRQHCFHFVGIGGSGMSPLAEILIGLGVRVSGSDLAASPITRRLAGLGARIAIGHAAANLGDAGIIIHTSAVTAENPEIQAAHDRRLPVMTRAGLLAELMTAGTAIAVAGAHGKTTTSAMITHMLAMAGLDPTAVIGGEVVGRDSGARSGSDDLIVAEADESDGSFRLFRPTIAVVTNIDREHLDYYQDDAAVEAAFLAFLNRLPLWGVAILNADDPALARIAGELPRRGVRFGLAGSGDVLGHSLEVTGQGTVMRVTAHGKDLGSFFVPVIGRHHAGNALAAIAAGLELGVEPDALRASMATYPGVKRRFQLRGITRGIRVYDDYGHHPTEIAATLHAARTLSPERVVCLFQPHRYTRTQSLWSDFIGAFTGADLIGLLPVYAASEQPIAGITSERLAASLVLAPHQQAVSLPGLAEAMTWLRGVTRPNDLLLTLGAGDVHRAATMFVEES